MNKRILRWQKWEYINAVMQVIVAFLWVSPRLFGWTNSENSLSYIFFWPWVIILILSSYTLIYRILVPELEFTGDLLEFHNQRKRWKIRAIVSVNKIDNIIESTRKTAGVTSMIDLPSYIIKTNDGNEYEYFPGVKPGKRLDEVKSFLLSCPGLPQIRNNSENQS